ncbi:SDR family oxidoreductase [Pseudomonas aeruginosa]|nr:SDR family oxidoreductase [Pseudomonas aeruginosa]
MTQRKAVLVMGAGDATGGAIAQRFAREGYVACVARRNAEKLEPLVQAIRDQGGEALACGCDARQEQQVIDLFARIEGEVGALEAVIFNVGANVWFPITETTERVYRKVWEMAAFGGFLTGREAARVMLPRQRGTLIFTGATASLRGRAHFAAFSGAKFALRALAQSMARELGPKGIHVAHPIIDGAIDTDFIRETLPELYKRKEQDGILDPEHIAETYWQIHCQPRDCWVHELDLRPWMETF